MRSSLVSVGVDWDLCFYGVPVGPATVNADRERVAAAAREQSGHPRSCADGRHPVAPDAVVRGSDGVATTVGAGERPCADTQF
jgi:hypothetical protein